METSSDIKDSTDGDVVNGKSLSEESSLYQTSSTYENSSTQIRNSSPSLAENHGMPYSGQTNGRSLIPAYVALTSSARTPPTTTVVGSVEFSQATRSAGEIFSGGVERTQPSLQPPNVIEGKGTPGTPLDTEATTWSLGQPENQTIAGISFQTPRTEDISTSSNLDKKEPVRMVGSWGPAHTETDGAQALENRSPRQAELRQGQQPLDQRIDPPVPLALSEEVALPPQPSGEAGQLGLSQQNLGGGVQSNGKTVLHQEARQQSVVNLVIKQELPNLNLPPPAPQQSDPQKFMQQQLVPQQLTRQDSLSEKHVQQQSVPQQLFQEKLQHVQPPVQHASGPQQLHQNPLVAQDQAILKQQEQQAQNTSVPQQHRPLQEISSENALHQMIPEQPPHQMIPQQHLQQQTTQQQQSEETIRQQQFKQQNASQQQALRPQPQIFEQIAPQQHGQSQIPLQQQPLQTMVIQQQVHEHVTHEQLQHLPQHHPFPQPPQSTSIPAPISVSSPGTTIVGMVGNTPIVRMTQGTTVIKKKKGRFNLLQEVPFVQTAGGAAANMTGAVANSATSTNLLVATPVTIETYTTVPVATPVPSAATSATALVLSPSRQPSFQQIAAEPSLPVCPAADTSATSPPPTSSTVPENPAISATGVNQTAQPVSPDINSQHRTATAQPAQGNSTATAAPLHAPIVRKKGRFVITSVSDPNILVQSTQAQMVPITLTASPAMFATINSPPAEGPQHSFGSAAVTYRPTAFVPQQVLYTAAAAQTSQQHQATFPSETPQQQPQDPLQAAKSNGLTKETLASPAGTPQQLQIKSTPSGQHQKQTKHQHYHEPYRPKTSIASQRGLGKLFYFLDQMRSEVSDADQLIKGLQSEIRSCHTEMKFLKEKNNELEAKAREAERRLSEERELREAAEETLTALRKMMREMKVNGSSNSGERRILSDSLTQSSTFFQSDASLNKTPTGSDLSTPSQAQITEDAETQAIQRLQQHKSEALNPDPNIPKENSPSMGNSALGDHAGLIVDQSNLKHLPGLSRTETAVKENSERPLKSQPDAARPAVSQKVNRLSGDIGIATLSRELEAASGPDDIPNANHKKGIARSKSVSVSSSDSTQERLPGWRSRSLTACDTAGNQNPWLGIAGSSSQESASSQFDPLLESVEECATNLPSNGSQSFFASSPSFSAMEYPTLGRMYQQTQLPVLMMEQQGMAYPIVGVANMEGVGIQRVDIQAQNPFVQIPSQQALLSPRHDATHQQMQSARSFHQDFSPSMFFVEETDMPLSQLVAFGDTDTAQGQVMTFQQTKIPQSQLMAFRQTEIPQNQLMTFEGAEMPQSHPMACHEADMGQSELMVLQHTELPQNEMFAFQQTEIPQSLAMAFQQAEIPQSGVVAFQETELPAGHMMAFQPEMSQRENIALHSPIFQWQGSNLPRTQGVGLHLAQQRIAGGQNLQGQQFMGQPRREHQEPIQNHRRIKSVDDFDPLKQPPHTDNSDLGNGSASTTPGSGASSSMDPFDDIPRFSFGLKGG